MIVDDHRLFAEAMGSILQSLGMDVVELPTSAGGAVSAVERHRPDLVLMDIGLPDRSGIAAGRDILERFPRTKVVALTGLDDPDVLKESMNVGFHGYLTKDTPVVQFVRSVESALEGQVVLPGRLARRAAEGRREAARPPSALTSREREVLGLLVEGLGSDDIARRLSISSNTVRTHVQNVLTKLQAHSRLEAAAIAVRQGLVSPSGSAR